MDNRPNAHFNDEDSNRSNNPSFDSVLGARLSRRSLLRGGAGAAVVGGAAISGCATTAGTASGPVNGLGFKPVARSIADAVVVPPGYSAQVLYAGGDPLTASTPAFRNDGTDTDWENRAGDHHDGMEWYGLDAQGRPSDTFTSRGLLAVNHEATTDEKLSSFFIHANGGTATLPRPGAEIDKELMIHGLSVVEVQRDGKRWVTKTDSRFNRRITTMSEAVFTGPAAGSAHLVTKYSPTGTKARGTVNNCAGGVTPMRSPSLRSHKRLRSVPNHAEASHASPRPSSASHASSRLMPTYQLNSGACSMCLCNGGNAAARFAAGGYHAVLARRSDADGLARMVSQIEAAGGSLRCCVACTGSSDSRCDSMRSGAQRASR